MKKNSLKIVYPKKFIHRIKNIIITGFSTFVDVVMGILTILFNNQIMKYLGSSALSVYGTIISFSTLAQCTVYSVGQASQPIISTNFGAKEYTRANEILWLSIKTAFAFWIFWCILSEVFQIFIYIFFFITPNNEVLNIAPSII